MSASAKAASGVFSVGFSTIRLLVATTGATLWITWFSGWLNGVMALMTPCSGSRNVYTLRDLPWCVRSQENTWPSSISAWLAANSSTSDARPTSYVRILQAQARFQRDQARQRSLREAMISPARIRIL